MRKTLQQVEVIQNSIPKPFNLGTLRDWEQGRTEPDQPTKAYLTLIARDPEHVDRTLNPKSR